MMDLKIGGADDGMGWFQFIAAMTGSLAWPFAAVIIAWFFHVQIGDLLTKVVSITWGDKTVKFQDLLNKAEADQVLVTPSKPAEIAVDQNTPFNQALNRSPAEGILFAWDRVEQKLIEICSHLHATGQGYPYAIIPLVALPNDLLARNVINRTQHKFMTDLYELRQAAMRENAENTANLTDADAIRFNNLSEKLVNSLNLIELPSQV